MSKRITDIEIAARVVPTMLRWPPEIAKTIAFDRMRDCVEALRSLVCAVNNGCVQAEQDQDLSPEGIARRRKQLGHQALTELAQFKPFQIAEKAITENLIFLEKHMKEIPKPPTTIADVMLAQEIRGYLSDQEHPIDVATKSMSDSRVLGAVLNAPPFLSGLTATEWNLVHQRARATLYPEQVQMGQWLIKARDEVRGGIKAAERVVRERCQMGEDEVSNREPLAGPKSAAA